MPGSQVRFSAWDYHIWGGVALKWGRVAKGHCQDIRTVVDTKISQSRALRHSQKQNAPQSFEPLCLPEAILTSTLLPSFPPPSRRTAYSYETRVHWPEAPYREVARKLQPISGQPWNIQIGPSGNNLKTIQLPVTWWEWGLAPDNHNRHHFKHENNDDR